jgi:fructan beta-fructosidase
MSLRLTSISLAFLLASAATSADDLRPDVLVNDFESTTYGDWKTEGEAFGPGPAAGTLPNQMPVSGFEGKRLVNSFFNGDATTGTLTSPEFRIQRRFLNFLIGGGGHAGQTCINLLHDGKVLRTAAGANSAAGGSEALDWHTWDVADLAGQTVTLQIVDSHTGGWGHINIDHILQSDQKRQHEPAQRELAITQRYLHLPVKTGAPKQRMRFEVDGSTVREFEIELATDAAEFLAFADVTSWIGQPLIIHVDKLPAGSTALDAITQSGELPDAGHIYTEQFRPQFHFTSQRGWLNDPNGLVYHEGAWHLFYQHNPYGWNWGNMHWGHAVSDDLFHWQELGEAIYPKEFGDWAFSGSAVVDRHNSAGLQQGDTQMLAAFYTSTGRGECVVFSGDGGRTWTEYDGNPVVKHNGRDPKVIWHDPSQRWVMAVYDEPEGQRQIAFYTSPDLKQWEFASRIDGFFECPDLFELSVDGDANTTRWVLYAADGRYVLGDFDGREFTPASDKLQLWHGNFYAAQTYSDAPDGRRVQVGWGQGINFPGMPFNQQMTVPVDLTLRSTSDGHRMFAEPVPELQKLRGRKSTQSDVSLSNNLQDISGPAGDLYDIDLTFTLDAAEAGLRFGNHIVAVKRHIRATRDVTHTLHVGGVTAPITLTDNRVQLRILIDRGSIEVFANDGALAISAAALLPADHPPLQLFATNGQATFGQVTVYDLSSAWTQAPQ